MDWETADTSVGEGVRGLLRDEELGRIALVMMNCGLEVQWQIYRKKS